MHVQGTAQFKKVQFSALNSLAEIAGAEGELAHKFPTASLMGLSPMGAESISVQDDLIDTLLTSCHIPW